jgi:hypothetical protein
MSRENNKYLVNTGDEEMGVCYEAAYISIHGGYLKLEDKNFKVIKEFEIHDGFGLYNYPFSHVGVKLIKAEE